MFGRETMSNISPEMTARAEFIIGENWRLLVICPHCNKVNAVWVRTLPSSMWLHASCWDCGIAWKVDGFYES